MKMDEAQASARKAERSAALQERLRNGFQRIGEAMSHGIEVDHWDDAWVELLGEYVALEDELAAHHAEVRQVVQAEMVGMPRKEIAA